MRIIVYRDFESRDCRDIVWLCQEDMLNATVGKTDQSDGSLQVEGRRPFLTIAMNLGLIAVSGLAGWVWTTVVGAAGEEVWFFMAGLCGVFLGVAIHQLIHKGRWILTLICLGAFVASMVTARNRGLSQPTPQASKPREPVFVRTESVDVQTFTEQFAFSGLIEPERSATLAFSDAGLIEALLVDDNDAVQSDQTLAKLNSDQLMANLEEAKAVCVRTESNRKRLEKLLAQNATSEMLRDDAIAEDRVAKARVKALNTKLEDMVLSAPFSGQIAERFVEEGEFASPGKPIFKLLLMNPVKAVVGVPEKMIGLIRPDAAADVMIEAMDATRQFTGRVTRVPLETASDSPLYAVEVTVPNDTGQLATGMAVRVSIEGRTFSNATVLKTSWVQRAGGQHYIFQSVPLEVAEDEFMAAHSLTSEELQDIVTLVADPTHVGVARKLVLESFVIRDGQYVVQDLPLDHPVVTRGAYLLEDLSIVRTGILKTSEDLIEDNEAGP